MSPADSRVIKFELVIQFDDAYTTGSKLRTKPLVCQMEAFSNMAW